jgi:hypothetical protein
MSSLYQCHPSINVRKVFRSSGIVREQVLLSRIVTLNVVLVRATVEVES